MSYVIEFTGGFADGRVWRTDSEDFDEARRAAWLCVVTRNGTKLGHVRAMRSDASLRPGQAGKPHPMHKYVLTKRLERDGDIIIQMAYSGVLKDWAELAREQHQ